MTTAHNGLQGFEDYLRSPHTLSPWLQVDGWHLKNAFHDPMHVVFLGTVRDLYASSMGFWMRKNFFGEGTLANKLNQFSRDLRTASRNQKILADGF